MEITMDLKMALEDMIAEKTGEKILHMDIDIPGLNEHVRKTTKSADGITIEMDMTEYNKAVIDRYRKACQAEDQYTVETYMELPVKVTFSVDEDGPQDVTVIVPDDLGKEIDDYAMEVAVEHMDEVRQEYEDARAEYLYEQARDTRLEREMERRAG